MKPNRAFLKSMHFLSRPVVLLLLGLLLANDFLLRRLWPSWWTGKLSDFTWLFIAPAFVAALLAWLVPARWSRQEKIAGLLAYGLTALAFTFLKTVPAFHETILQLWQSSLGFPAAAVIDPTDLLALSMLVFSAILWFREKPAPTRIPLRGWLILPFFALLTMADAAAPDYGIACLSLNHNQVIASAGYSTYASQDGGLTWAEAEPGSNVQPCYSPGGKMNVIDLPGAKLRGSVGAGVEISRDGGNTWQVEYRLSENSQSMDSYYSYTAGGNPILIPGPLDAIYDPVSGNTLFAMGHQGVLVRREDATYTWVSVGSYNRPDLASPSVFLTVLGRELDLSAALVLLLFATGALMIKKYHWAIKLLAILFWLVWLVGTISSPARTSGSEIQAIIGIIIWVVLILALISGIWGAIALFRQHAWRGFIMALTGGIMFLLPYYFWYINAIPDYFIALMVALAIALASALVILRDGRSWAKPANQDPKGF